MSRLIAVSTCFLLFVTASAQASHAELSRAYAAQKAEFTREYQAQRTALRHAYRCAHDQLIAERKLIARIDCHETRSARLRANSRDLGQLSRENGRRNRELSLVYSDGLRTLRDEYDLAREAYRRDRRIAPVHVLSHHAHPTNCTCDACVPQPPIHRHRYDDRNYRNRHFGSHHQVPYRKPNGLDIAVAILSILK